MPSHLDKLLPPTQYLTYQPHRPLRCETKCQMAKKKKKNTVALYGEIEYVKAVALELHDCLNIKVWWSRVGTLHFVHDTIRYLTQRSFFRNSCSPPWGTAMPCGMLEREFFF